MSYEMVNDRKEYHKEWYINNKEKIKQQNKESYKKNKEKVNERSKKWYEDNKEKHKYIMKEYRQTPIGIKITTINNWKTYGLKLFGYTYDEVYEYYLNCNNCEICNKDISIGGHQKNMDHCHSTGIFRWVLCASCNGKDNWMNKV